MINLGNMEIADLRLGASQVKAVYFGNEQVWSGEEPIPVGDALCFTTEQANNWVKLYKHGSPTDISIEYSYNGKTWTKYDTFGSQIALANVGDKVYIRAMAENATIGSSSSNYYYFGCYTNVAASGNIQSLLKADCSRTDAPAYCYYELFSSMTNRLTQAPELPATTINDYCYAGMFRNCSSLTSAPTLPAMTLA